MLSRRLHAPQDVYAGGLLDDPTAIQRYCPRGLPDDPAAQQEMEVSVSGLVYSHTRPEILVNYQVRSLPSPRKTERDPPRGVCHGGSFASIMRYHGELGADARDAVPAQRQGDQIYGLSTVEGAEGVGKGEITRECYSLGGHINQATFLKSVRYFGPSDE
jgi:hypothetical protein